MKIWFKDWRRCSQDIIPLELDTDQIYYIHAKAWHIKGYLGGTHSWTTFYDHTHNRWLVAEYTDRETLAYQNAKIIYDGNLTKDDKKHAPYISDRPYNAQWFGSDPKIVDHCLACEADKILAACKSFPYDGFSLLTLNCNTFTSYLHYKLNLNLKRPLRSVGYKNKDKWRKNGT